MSAPLRSVSLLDSENETLEANNLVGLDESEGDTVVIVAVRCAREDDIALVRALIENELRPFRHKSSSIVRYGDLSEEERADRVGDFIDDLETVSVSWGAIVCERDISSQHKAAAATVAGKKSITNGLATGDVAHGCGKTALLHDGRHNSHTDYHPALRESIPSHIDSSFQQSICPVYLTFLEDADRIYPQTTAADYIAGYLRDQLDSVDDVSSLGMDAVKVFDESWVDPAPQPEPVYQLESFQPIREEGRKSRVLAWLKGQGIPDDPSPTGRDPYLNLIDQIEDDVVYTYLRNEI